MACWSNQTSFWAEPIPLSYTLADSSEWGSEVEWLKKGGKKLAGSLNIVNLCSSTGWPWLPAMLWREASFAHLPHNCPLGHKDDGHMYSSCSGVYDRLCTFSLLSLLPWGSGKSSDKSLPVFASLKFLEEKPGILLQLSSLWTCEKAFPQGHCLCISFPLGWARLLVSVSV